MGEYTYGQRFDPNFNRINNRPEDVLPKYDPDEIEALEEAEEEGADA